ncbi:MAG: hypothetical protein WD823_05905, partial [Sulfuricaulis sp.]|uniref:hypothetical protein n=1 Tax=Sulfuricaulis sp. TaxID=2003553 RepID=UPI0034A50B3F
ARRPPFEGAAPRKGVAPPAPETQAFGDGSRLRLKERSSRWQPGVLPPKELRHERESPCATGSGG